MSSKATQNYFSTKGIGIKTLPPSNLIYKALKQRSGKCTFITLKIKQKKAEILQVCATDEGNVKVLTCHYTKGSTNGPAMSQISKTAKVFLACSGLQLKRFYTHCNRHQVSSLYKSICDSQIWSSLFEFAQKISFQ